MCLAIPLKITRIENQMADVELGGVTRQVSIILTPEAQVGDWVLVHTGFAINLLNEEEAQETLSLFAELEEAERELEAEEALAREATNPAREADARAKDGEAAEA